MSIDVVLVTGQHLPIADAEGPQIVERLHGRGVSAEIREWGRDNCADAGLVVVRSTWDYTDRRIEFLEWVRSVDATSRVVNPPAVIEWNSHKNYLLELAASGVPVVPTEVVPAGSSPAEQRAALARADEQVVVKPAVGAGARGALRAATADPALVEHLAQLVAEQDVLVQPYVDTIATSGETSLIYFHGELSHAVRKLPGAGDYRIHEHLGGSTHSHDPTDVEREVAARALAHLSLDQPLTYARVDLVHLPAGPALMELELIEPFLFLEYAAGSLDCFVEALMSEIAPA